MTVKNVSYETIEEIQDLALEESKGFRPDGVNKKVQLQGHWVDLYDSVFKFKATARIRRREGSWDNYYVLFIKYHGRVYVNIRFRNFTADKEKEIPLEKAPKYVQEIIGICIEYIDCGKRVTA